MQTPPGPKGDWLIGNILALTERPHTFFLESARTYGDVVALSKDVFLINHPDDIAFVLANTNLIDFTKESSRSQQRRTSDVGYFSDGLVNTSDENWRRQRHRDKRMFHKDKVAPFIKYVAETTHSMVSSWSLGVPRDIYADVIRLTLQQSSSFLFRADMTNEVVTIADVMEELQAAALRPLKLPQWLPLPQNIRLRRVMSRFDDLILQIIDKHRTPTEVENTLLGVLLNSYDEDPSSSLNEVRDEIATMLLAGYETPASGITWAWWLLTQHPDAANKIRLEAQIALPKLLQGQASIDDLLYT